MDTRFTYTAKTIGKKNPLLVLALIVAIATAMMTSQTASAGGATVEHNKIDYDHCYPSSNSGSRWNYSWGYSREICNTATGQVHLVETPSGNIIIHHVEEGGLSVDESGWFLSHTGNIPNYTRETSFDSEYSINQKYLVKNWKDQVLKWAYTYTETSTWDFDYEDDALDYSGE